MRQSKKCMAFTPVSPAWKAVPPMTASRPSGMRVWKAQYSDTFSPGVGVKAPVSGFHRRALV